MTTTKDFSEVIRAELAADPRLARAVESETISAEIAQLVYDLRMARGMTQAELAQWIGVKQPAIAKIEDSDYNWGHAMLVLQKIASAFGKRLRIVFDERA